MLIKLIPPLAEPTIHFSLSFPDLPQHLPTPPSWMSQYNHLMLEDLEVPNAMHSLDTAAGLPSIIDEVAFDLAERRIRCLFVDGNVEEWEMGVEGDEAKPLLEIVGFVQDSTMEDERDKEREREKQREKERDRERSTALQHKTSRSSRFSYSSTSSAGPKVNRHKKQRSFFMQIVSSLGSIINLTSPPTTQMLPFSDSETPAQASSSLPPNQRAKALRRAARSGLVDTFRRFVLPVLRRRVPFSGPHNGFCAWILWSMKRRALERREHILRECGLTSEMLEHAMEQAFEATTMDVPSSLSDSETESFDVSPVEEDVPSLDDDNGTEYTDGSSLRTPSTASHNHYAKSKCKKIRMSISSDTFTYRSSTSLSTTSSTSSAEPVQAGEPPLAVAQSPLPPSKSQISLLPPPLPPKSPRNYKTQLLQNHLPPHLYAEHIHVVALAQRVEGLIAFRETQTRVALEEQKARMEILSVRGKRRAWSAGIKVPGAAGQEGQGQEWGFAVPFRSSPLARYGWVVGGRRGLQRCGDGVDEEDEEEEMDVTDEECEDEFLGGPVDADDILELDEEDDPFRSSPSPLNGISVAGFPVTRQRSNVPYRRSSTPPPSPPPSNIIEGRERKHYRSWQKVSTITVPSSEPVITTKRNSYPNPNLHLQNNQLADVNRRRVSLGPSSLPLSRLFPVSEELEVEMDVREDDMDLEMGLGGFGRNYNGMRRRGRVIRSMSSFSDDEDQDERQGQGYQGPTLNNHNHNLTHDQEEEDEGQYPARCHSQDDFPTSPTSTASFSSMSSGGGRSSSSSPSFTFDTRPRSPSPPPVEYDRARDSPSPPADRRREAFELERPQVLPRMRTKSFGIVGRGGRGLAQAQAQPLERQKRSLWGEHREGGGLALSRDSLLCQPLSRRVCATTADVGPGSGFYNDEGDSEESDDEDFPFDCHHSSASGHAGNIDKMMRISFGRTEFPLPEPSNVNEARTRSSSSNGSGKTSPVGIPSGVTPDDDAEEVPLTPPPLPPRAPPPQPSQPQLLHFQQTHHSSPSYPPRFMAPSPSDGLGSGEEFTLAMDVTCKIPSLGITRPSPNLGRKGFGSYSPSHSTSQSPSRVLPPVPVLSPPPVPLFKEMTRSPPLSYAISPRHDGVVYIPRPRPKLEDLFPIDASVEVDVEVGLAPPTELVIIGSAC